MKTMNDGRTAMRSAATRFTCRKNFGSTGVWRFALCVCCASARPLRKQPHGAGSGRRAVPPPRGAAHCNRRRPHPRQAAAPAADNSAAPPADANSPPPPITDASLPSTLPRDLTPWGMFLSAVLPVKIVMVGLAFASLATWTVWLAKTIELWMQNARRGAALPCSPAQRACARRIKCSPRSKRDRRWRGLLELPLARLIVPKVLPPKASRTAPQHFCRASRRKREE